MKVVLVSSNLVTMPYPVYPLGLGVIASAVRQAGHEVRIFDLLAAQGDTGRLAAMLVQDLPGVVGVSVRNIDDTNSLSEREYIRDVVRVVACVREACDAIVVLGGAGYSIMPERILQESGADYGVVGEGERAFVELLARIEGGNPPAERVLAAPYRLAGADIPAAYYDDELLRFYFSEGGVAPVQTKRGCPLRCKYCSYPVLEGKALRPRPPGAVVDEVAELVERYGAKYIFFADSVFNDVSGQYREVARGLKQRGLRVPWAAFFRPAGLSAGDIELMRESGLAAAELGTDASTDTTLRRMGKGFRFEDALAVDRLLVSAGIATAHFLMFGGPGETRETVREGLGNLMQFEKSVVFSFLGIRILPGTELADIAVAEGVLAPDQDLLPPTYYFSPQVDRDWLHEALTAGFAGRKNCVYPPDAYNNALRLLHKLGHTGPLWDLLVARESRERGTGSRHVAP